MVIADGTIFRWPSRWSTHGADTHDDRSSWIFPGDALQQGIGFILCLAGLLVAQSAV